MRGIPAHTAAGASELLSGWSYTRPACHGQSQLSNRPQSKVILQRHNANGISCLKAGLDTDSMVPLDQRGDAVAARKVGYSADREQLPPSPNHGAVQALVSQDWYRNHLDTIQAPLHEIAFLLPMGQSCRWFLLKHGRSSSHSHWLWRRGTAGESNDASCDAKEADPASHIVPEVTDTRRFCITGGTAAATPATARPCARNDLQHHSRP